MEKVNQRIMLTKRLLKESFIELLLEKDIHKIAIRELCERAGINHCTFYKYYGSQYDLLKEMESDMIQKIEQTLADQKAVDPIHILFNYLEENIKVARLLINNNLDPEFPEKLFSLPLIQQQFIAILSKNYDSRDFEYISNFIFYGAFHIVQMWVNKTERESPDDVIRLIISIATKLNL